MLALLQFVLFILSDSKKKDELDTALTLTYLTHSAGFTVTWIEYLMFFKPIVMMRRMMWMFVSYRLRMALMVEEMRMLVICIRVVVASHGP